jgi:DNA-directed RNA polymerase subunit RPC12/RpoP
LQRLFRGGLPAKQAAEIEQHVQTCAQCLRQLKQLLPERDTLTDALQDKPTLGDTPQPAVVADLMTKLKSLHKATTPTTNPGAAMVAFQCTGCGKKLSAKEAMAGKKVKCPGCGQLMTVPVKAPVTSGDDMPTLAPKTADLDAKTRAAADAASMQTRSPASQSDATQGLGNDEDSALTDFLAPPQSPDELGRLGKYRILRILGHGGMGVVYKGEDPQLKRTVAIKAMLPGMAASASAGKRFLREAQAMAAVKHDHIVSIYDVGEDRGVPFLAMEFLHGEPLDERLKRETKLPVTEVIRIGREIAEALDAAHSVGLIHRDIKPANIWMETRGDIGERRRRNRD